MKIVLIATIFFYNLLLADSSLKCKQYNSFKQPDKYINCLNEYSDKNNLTAKKQLADFYYQGQQPYKNYKKAAYLYKEIANKDANIQYTLGLIYNLGNHGIIVDYKKAKFWYQKAANNGNVGAIVNLANLYTKGLGTNKNCNKAVSLYKQAANKNFWAAQDTLGHMYFNGRCVNKDIEKAKYWIRKGHQNGNSDTYFWHMQNWGAID